LYLYSPYPGHPLARARPVRFVRPKESKALAIYAPVLLPGKSSDGRKRLIVAGDGKTSKQEWMRSMEVEFDRLDKTRNELLDLKELAES
jgi:hypothetical protein